MQTVNVHYIDYETLNKDTAICLYDSVLLHVNASFNGTVSYNWSLSPDFSSLLNAPDNPDITVSPTQTTTYYWQAQTDHCMVSGKTTVKISIKIESLGDLAICHGELAKLQLHYTSSGSCTFNWSPEAKIVSGVHTATPVVAPTQSTQYTVIVIGENGCADTAVCYVTVHPKLLPDRIEAWADEYAIISGNPVQLHATPLYGQNVSYSWSPNDSLDNSAVTNPIANPAQTTVYTVTVTDMNGCSKSDTVLIRVSHLDCDEPFVYIPNAFTPNSDGINDQFRLRSKILESMLLRVYDRWGELLFETTKLDEGWDGTFRGKPCDPGVYVFYVEAVCFNKQPFTRKGNVTLMR
jgi:gliding motility-associated-like protein